jgi:hypothetical protein
MQLKKLVRALRSDVVQSDYGKNQIAKHKPDITAMFTAYFLDLAVLQLGKFFF